MKTLMLVFALVSITIAGDGPFGIDFGTPISSFNAIKKGDIYILDSVPEPDTNFTMYMVRATEKHGIFWIKGIGKIYKLAPTGEVLRLNADKIAKQISASFGEDYKLYDYLKNGSTLTGPEKWVEGLVKEERRYVYTWNSNLTPTFISSEVKSIFITPVALNNSQGVITIEYLGANYDAAVGNKVISYLD
jgi:hypothetical protein